VSVVKGLNARTSAVGEFERGRGTGEDQGENRFFAASRAPISRLLLLLLLPVVVVVAVAAVAAEASCRWVRTNGHVVAATFHAA
jgi:hypothetical protein